MTHFTESTIKETTLEWLGCQQIACGSSGEQILVLAKSSKQQENGSHV